MATFTLPSPADPHSPRLLARAGWKPRFPWSKAKAAQVNQAAKFARVQTQTALPRRFDIHRIDAFTQWVAQQSPMCTTEVTIDANQVRFIDNAAIEAILKAKQSLASRDITLRIINPSVALQITLELTPVASILGTTTARNSKTNTTRKVLS